MLVKLKLYYFKLPSNSTNRLYCFDSQMKKMKFKTLKKNLPTVTQIVNVKSKIWTTISAPIASCLLSSHWRKDLSAPDGKSQPWCLLCSSGTSWDALMGPVFFAKPLQGWWPLAESQLHPDPCWHGGSAILAYLQPEFHAVWALFHKLDKLGSDRSRT